MRSWRSAMRTALYDEGGFYRRVEGPAAHFRTSTHVGTAFATALVELLRRVDDGLRRPARLDLVDVGAGRGELLRAVHISRDCFGGRLRLTGVDVAARPGGLPDDIRWGSRIPALTGLLVANEWLDVVPVDVVELTPAGQRTVLVDRTGEEAPGPPPAADDLAWLSRWWPLRRVGDRAEVGSTRDAAWASAVGRVRAGVAVAIDYGHVAGARPRQGSLVGYRGGACVRPVPDGSCDLTAHVALDACAVAVPGPLMTQREALRSLGVAADRPDPELAERAPAAYLRALAAAGEAGELLNPGGLGGFGWLLHGVGMAVPLSSRCLVPPLPYLSHAVR